MQYKNIVDIMVQVKGKGMKWWNWEERKAVTNHVTINRKMSNGDSLGTWRIPITHLKDTHQIPLRYPIVYWPIAPSRSSFSLIASIIYELKSRDVLLVALSSAWASKYDSGMALRFSAFVLAATGRPETGLLLLRQKKKFVIWQNPPGFSVFQPVH